MDELSLSDEGYQRRPEWHTTLLAFSIRYVFPKVCRKDLFSGVLKVKEREIVWLEIPFGGQTILSLDTQAVEKYLDKLDAKTTVGELLAVKAQAQGLKLVDAPEADEVYTREWALNTAAVTKLLLGINF